MFLGCAKEPAQRFLTLGVELNTAPSQNGDVAQLVRAPACHAGGRRFEPVHPRLGLLRPLSGKIFFVTPSLLKRKSELNPAQPLVGASAFSIAKRFFRAEPLRT